MGRFAIVVMMLAAACENKTPRYEGPLRVQLGDCAEDAIWVSGPRPLPPSARVAKKPDDKPRVDDNGDPILDRQQAIDQAREAGIIGGTEGGGFASLTGTGEISSGFDDTNIYGGLLGNEAGEMAGGFGFDRSGFSPGTGGTIGLGRYGTIGRGSGSGGGMRGRRASLPTVSIGQPNAQGDLDKAIIRRYIKRNIQRIQYCYEKELLARPNISGTVMTQFFIGPDGSVKASSGSGMDPNVSSCVAGVIKGIEFPKPKGGGGVQVNYPFTFRPAGDSTTTPPPPPPVDSQAPPPVKPDPKPGKPDAPSRYTPGGSNPLLAQRDALEECFRSNPKPYGALTVKLDWTGTRVTAAAANGVSEDVAKCVVEAAQKITRTSGTATSQTCSVAFGDMPPADLPSIEITAEAIKMDGVPVIDPKATEKLRFKIEPLFAKIEAKTKRDRETSTPVSIIGPLMVRPIDTTPIAVVNKVLSTTYMAGGDFVLAASDGASWKIIDLVAIPVPPVPRGTGGRWSTWKQFGGLRGDDEAVTLSILMTKERTWLGLSRVNEFQEVPILASKEHDYDKIERALVEHKKTALFAGRTDLEIGGEDVTWRDVVRMIEIARKVGFVDFRISAPEGLAARPQL